jgi:tRNA (mo5U34)-methyltransferase
MGTQASLEERIQAFPWWHRMELAPGVWTPGGKGEGTQKTLEQIHMPSSLRGKTVLDIGAWDGFYSFEAERRGADRVVATDSYIWDGGCLPVGSKQGFLLAREVLGSKVEDVHIDVMDLSPERVGTFDVTLCLGVLYHVRHPLLMLERVASVTRELLILETYVDSIGGSVPTAVFYPGVELGGDPSNWWGPNPACVAAMLRDVGFARVELFPEAQRQRKPPSLWKRVRKALRRAEAPSLEQIPPHQRGARLAAHGYR